LGYDFAWGFEELPLDRALALAETVAIADAESGSAAGVMLRDNEQQDDEDGGGELGMELHDEDPPLPEALGAFRSRARINTYTVIGPDLALDDYPGAEGRLDQYPIIFGANSSRVRTLDGG
jgi:hypothetical protein